MSSTAYSSHATMEETEIVKRKRKGKSMREIIKELKVQLLSEIKPRNPDAFVRKAKEEGIMVIEGTRGDIAIVDPEFYDEFMSRLKYFPKNIEEIELGSVEKKFFNFLRVNALIYFDGNKWVSVV